MSGLPVGRITFAPKPGRYCVYCGHKLTRDDPRTKPWTCRYCADLPKLEPR